jgi:hypothetical protein
MKINHYSTLHALHDIDPQDAQDNIDAMFEATDLDCAIAILTRRPDGGMIGSTHFKKYRIH